MTMKLGELVAYLKVDKKQLTVGLEAAKAETKAAGDSMDKSSAAAAASVARSWLNGFGLISTGSRTNSNQLARDIDATKLKIRQLGLEYDRTGNKSLLKDLSKERSQLKALESVVSELATGGLATARTALNNFASGFTNVATNVWNLIPILLGLAAAALLAVPAVYLLGGALGALPALAFGGGAAIGALVLGFMGLGDAFRKTASSGSTVVDRAYQIAVAERRVRDANKEVTASQEALNRARLTAALRMRDLTRNLTGAHLDEESAIAAVASAQRDLDAARLTENPDRIAAADLALRQQQQSLADVRDRVADLTREQADAAAKGVEGSDEVTAALDRQQHAVEGVTDAMHGLKEAQKPPPSGGGAAAQITKLAPSAAAFVAAIKSLKPAFDSLRLDVQEKLFKGVGAEIKSLATAWLPTLHARLGGMADMFNGLFKNLAKTAKKPEFIANISAGMESVQRLFDRIGKSLTGPFLDALGTLSRAAGPFIDALGEGIGGILDDFSAWIDAADKSGSLTTFFEKAGKFFLDVLDIGKDVGSILGSIFSIITKSFEKQQDDSMTTFKDKMDALAKWFADPANQKKIADFLTKLQDFYFWVKNEAIPWTGKWIDRLQGFADRLAGWGHQAIAFRDQVVGAFDALVGAVSGLPGRIGNAASGMWNGILTGFKVAINWIIGKWNNLGFTIGGGSFMGISIPSARFDTPDIPYLARGGVIDPTPGGRLAVLGEAGKREIATPEDLLRRIVREETNSGHAEALVVENHIHVGDEVVKVVRTEIKESNRNTKRQVQTGAGTR